MTVAVLAISSGPVKAQAKGESQPMDRAKLIDHLITQLGSSKFTEREAAARELTRMGKEALPALEKATWNSDLEISRRAQAIVYTLVPFKDSFSILSVNGDLVVPIKGVFKQILIGDINGNGKIEGLDIDAEEIWIGSINGNANVKFKGKGKKLRLGSINGDCRIDTSEFRADEVEIAEMNGSARIKLQSAGPVRFTGDLNGGTTSVVKAQGDIRFAKVIQGGSNLELFTHGAVFFESQLGGGALLKIPLARDITVQGEIGDNVRMEANYFGEAKFTVFPHARIVLNKVTVPK